jgi:hypothetical protein
MSVVDPHEFLDFPIPDCIYGVCTSGDSPMVEAPVNRIKEHLREAMPATRRDREENYIDTLQLALDTLRGLMTSFSPDMQFKAVTAMLDFEKTRLRHNNPLAGIEIVPPVNLDDPIGTMPMPKYDKPAKAEEQIIDEIVDEDEVIDLDELTPKEQIAFKAMVEEAVEFFNVEGEQRDAVRKRIELQLWNDLGEYGFETMARSFRHCMDKRKAKAARQDVHPPSASGTLDWPK